MAFAAWSEYNIDGQFKKDAIASDDSMLEPLQNTMQTSSLINGSLSCFCEQQVGQNGWVNTAFKRYEYKSKGSELSSGSLES